VARLDTDTTPGQSAAARRELPSDFSALEELAVDQPSSLHRAATIRTTDLPHDLFVPASAM